MLTPNGHLKDSEDQLAEFDKKYIGLESWTQPLIKATVIGPHSRTFSTFLLKCFLRTLENQRVREKTLNS